MTLPEAATRKLAINGQGFAYKFLGQALGDQAPIFFVSGAFQSMKSWSWFASYMLERGIPIIVADLPGVGDSNPLPAEFGLDLLSESIKLVLDDAYISQASIISVSYGTPIGYRFAQKHPDRIKNLVLAGTMKEIPVHMRQRTKDTLIPLRAGEMSRFAEAVVAGLMCLEAGKHVARRDLARRLLTSQLKNMSMAEREKFALNTMRLLTEKPLGLQNPPTCPTLIFTGEHDSFTRPEYCEEMANAFEDCLFTTIADADHLFHLEQPSVAADLCYRFTQGLPLDAVGGIAPIRKSRP
jgi:pimeloyl-ACP methyl ester carboxylesterase